MRVHFFFVCIVGFFNSRHCASLEDVPFFDEFVNAFGIRDGPARQAF